MSYKVLNVGQCDPDHGSISRFLQGHFDVAIDRSKLPADTLEKLRSEKYDLVLINRKLDEDYSEGMDILKTMQADEELKSIPVMIVSNFAESQEEAVAAGAQYGFGKDEYDQPQAIERLKPFLSASE